MTAAAHEGRRLLVVLLCLLPVAVLVVQLQVALTIHSDSEERRLAREQTIQQYVDGRSVVKGHVERDWVIINARVLVRYLIKAVHRVMPRAGVVAANGVVQIAFLWAGLFFTYLLGRQFVDAGWAMAATLASTVWLSLTFLAHGLLGNIPYDLPTLFFSALALWAIATRRFAVLVVAVALGTLNKETIVWCIAAYLFNEIRLAGWRDRGTWIRFAVLCVIFVVLYEVPRVMLAPRETAQAVTVSTLDSPLGRFVPNIKHLALMHRVKPLRHFYVAMLLHLPAVLLFRRLPGMLKAAYLATLVFFAPILLFGNLWELRLYNDLVPLGAVASAYALATLLGDRDPQRPNAAPAAS
jgi:hypothetical protein